MADSDQRINETMQLVYNSHLLQPTESFELKGVKHDTQKPQTQYYVMYMPWSMLDNYHFVVLDTYCQPVLKRVTDFVSQPEPGNAARILEQILWLLEGKSLWDIPKPWRESIGQVWKLGADKYGVGNWQGGFKWSRIVRALYDHLYDHLQGSEPDPESGCGHLAHAFCCAVMLFCHVSQGLGENDLPHGKL